MSRGNRYAAHAHVQHFLKPRGIFGRRAFLIIVEAALF
jgi:hypothetical protein